MIAKGLINDASTTAKTVIEAGKRAAQKLIDNARVQAMNLEPIAIETVKDQLDGILEDGKKMVDDLVKQQTGYTLQEGRYQALEAFSRVKGFVNDGPLKSKAERVASQVREPETLEEIVKKMPDGVYNSFFLNEILETVDKAKTIVTQTRDLGANAIDNMTKHMKFIIDNFKKGPALENPKMFNIFSIDTESVKSSTDTSQAQYTKDADVAGGGDYVARDLPKLDAGATTSSLVSELGKSKATTTGMEYDYSDKKKTAEVSNLAVDMLKTVVPILLVLKDLFIKFNTNRDGLKDDAMERTVDLLNHNNVGKTQIPAKDIYNPLLASIDGLDIVPEGQVDSDLDPYYMYDAQYVDMVPTSPVAYISDNPSNFSELGRIYSSIATSLKVCKYNPDYPLKSLSTPTNGGKVENLRHAGNNKEELVDAIEALNGGERLRDVNDETSYEKEYSSLVLEDLMSQRPI